MPQALIARYFQFYLGSAREGSGVVVEVALPGAMANRYYHRGGVNRECPISNGLTTVAVGGMDQDLRRARDKKTYAGLILNC